MLYRLGPGRYDARAGAFAVDMPFGLCRRTSMPKIVTKSKNNSRKLGSTADSDPMSKQALKTQRAREAIIKAVISLIKEGGFSNASSTRIAERAGLTWGAAQHHFGSKEEILDEVMLIAHNTFSTRLADPRLRQGSLNDRIDMFVECTWAHYQEDIFLATLEIMMATRGFHDQPSAQEERLARRYPAVIRDIFRDIQLNDSQAREVITFVHCFLTGMTIERLFERKPKNVGSNLQRIKLALQIMLQGM